MIWAVSPRRHRSAGHRRTAATAGEVEPARTSGCSGSRRAAGRRARKPTWFSGRAAPGHASSHGSLSDVHTRASGAIACAISCTQSGWAVGAEVEEKLGGCGIAGQEADHPADERSVVTTVPAMSAGRRAACCAAAGRRRSCHCRQECSHRSGDVRHRLSRPAGPRRSDQPFTTPRYPAKWLLGVPGP